MAIILCVILLYLGVLVYDFIPQYRQRRKKKGFWLYSLFLIVSFSVLMLVGFGVRMDLAWVFGLG